MSLSISTSTQRFSVITTRPVLTIGLAIVFFWVFVALTIDIWSVYDPLKIVGQKLLEPSL